MSHGRQAARIAVAAPTAASRSAAATGDNFGRIIGVVGMARMGHDAAQPQPGAASIARGERDDSVVRRQAAAMLAAVDLDQEGKRDVALDREARGGRDHVG